MSDSRENPQIKHKRYKKSDFKVKKDPRTGLHIFSGPKFTREDIDREFPEDDNDRMTTLIRRSVGL